MVGEHPWSGVEVAPAWAPASGSGGGVGSRRGRQAIVGRGAADPRPGGGARSGIRDRRRQSFPPADPAHEPAVSFVQIANHFLEVLAEPVLALSMGAEYGYDRTVFPTFHCLEGSVSNGEVLLTKSATNQSDSPLRGSGRFETSQAAQRLHRERRCGRFETVVTKRFEKDTPGVRLQCGGKNLLRGVGEPVLERFVPERSQKAHLETTPIGRRPFGDNRLGQNGHPALGGLNGDLARPVTRVEGGPFPGLVEKVSVLISGLSPVSRVAGTAARPKDSASGGPSGTAPGGPRGGRASPPRRIPGARSWRGIADPGSEADGGAWRRQRP